jgi:Ca2+-binding RTX toxin-like protein
MCWRRATRRPRPCSNIALNGTSGKDVIYSSGANDALTGGASSDAFVFNANFGNDTITDFTPGTDTIQVDHTAVATVAALLASATASGSDVLLTTGDTHGDTITLKNVSLAQLHQSDFHIT